MVDDMGRATGTAELLRREPTGSMINILTAVVSFAFASALALFVAVGLSLELSRTAPALVDLPGAVVAPISLLFFTSASIALGSRWFSTAFAIVAFLCALAAVCLLARKPVIFEPPLAVWALPGFALITAARRVARSTATNSTLRYAVSFAVVTVFGVMTGVALHAGPWSTQWTSERGRLQAFYSEHHSEFAEIEQIAAQSDATIRSKGHVKLPEHLCDLTADCLVSDTAPIPVADSVSAKTSRRTVVIPFVASSIYRDSVVGFVHFSGPPHAPPNRFADGRCPRYNLGDGWWFMDYPNDKVPGFVCN